RRDVPAPWTRTLPRARRRARPPRPRGAPRCRARSRARGRRSLSSTSRALPRRRADQASSLEVRACRRAAALDLVVGPSILAVPARDHLLERLRFGLLLDQRGDIAAHAGGATTPHDGLRAGPRALGQADRDLLGHTGIYTTPFSSEPVSASHAALSREGRAASIRVGAWG